MGELTVVSAKIPEEVYEELVLRVPDGDRSSFIREAIVEKLREIPRPSKIFELEKKIGRLEADISRIKESLAELELLTYDKGKVNPHAFCTDDIDHKILDHLLHYKSATTSELADVLGTNRWLILNRLRKIKKRSKKQLGNAIIEYYPGRKSGKMKAWWVDDELVET
ncbi:MAG: hypothetical protein JSW53_01710 [Candidatus Bathyarchaeota archaeon]|nr:MAG: hypothetical protein JSW53_01710 [Candidatus Bathyarchaeota archaeon]